jgi:predicted nucleotidyltransferase
MMRDGLDHLPAVKRRELERVARVLFDEFEDAVKTKLSDKRKGGRILKLILFGSYARGDWVEDRASGYISDYDLLIVVNSDTFTDLQTWWAAADDHLVRELTVTRHLATPVNFIVHSTASPSTKRRDSASLRPASSTRRNATPKPWRTMTSGSPMPLTA